MHMILRSKSADLWFIKREYLEQYWIVLECNIVQHHRRQVLFTQINLPATTTATNQQYTTAIIQDFQSHHSSCLWQCQCLSLRSLPVGVATGSIIRRVGITVVNKVSPTFHLQRMCGSLVATTHFTFHRSLVIVMIVVMNIVLLRQHSANRVWATKQNLCDHHVALKKAQKKHLVCRVDRRATNIPCTNRSYREKRHSWIDRR